MGFGLSRAGSDRRATSHQERGHACRRRIRGKHGRAVNAVEGAAVGNPVGGLWLNCRVACTRRVERGADGLVRARHGGTRRHTAHRSGCCSSHRRVVRTARRASVRDVGGPCPYEAGRNAYSSIVDARDRFCRNLRAWHGGNLPDDAE